MTQAIQYSQLGGPDVLRLVEVPLPTPAAGEVGIRVEAAGVNPIDVKLRSGFRPSGPFDGPRGTGQDGAGIVTAVGEGVDAFRVGDPVAFANTFGAYATDVVATASDVFARPAGVSPEQAAALGVPAATAYQAVRSLAITGADTVLIHAGSGSVGQFAIQFAKLFGAKVIATASEARAEVVRALGAIPVTYGEGLADRVRSLSDSVTVALDLAGTDEAIAVSQELVADHSRIATIVRGADAAGFGIRAFAGGAPQPLTKQQLELRREAIAVSLALLAQGALTIEIGKTYPLAEAAQAQADSEAGAPGKLVVLP